MRMRLFLLLLAAVSLWIPDAQAAFFGAGTHGGGYFKSPGLSVLSGLSLWLKPDTGMTLDTGAPGTTVSQWANQAGNGSTYDFSQSTKANQPSYIGNCVNGYACLRFDGTNHFMTGGVGAKNITNNIGGLTVFIVGKTSNTGTTQHMAYFSTDSAATSNRASCNKSSTNKYQLGGRRLNADTPQFVTEATADDAGYHVLAFVFDYANSDAWVFKNGTQVASSTTYQTDGNTTGANSSAAAIGAIGDGSTNKITGDIAEIIVYQRVLTTTERQEVRQYLGDKYNL
ncbi:MAG TPA: hypothetical protein V6C52_12380 [Coleofasciculaceae cyanobacterium]|jgi:hypothetical protein